MRPITFTDPHPAFAKLNAAVSTLEQRSTLLDESRMLIRDMMHELDYCTSVMPTVSKTDKEHYANAGALMQRADAMLDKIRRTAT